jgi:DNA-binding response OmpR family regulator
MNSVLVIDDDPKVRGALAQAFKRAGYEVLDAADGRQGIDLYRERHADLVVTDILMPEKDGWDTISELRSGFPEARIIAISGGGPNLGPYTCLTVGKQLGADRVLLKPFKLEDLINVAGELLSAEAVVRP